MSRASIVTNVLSCLTFRSIRHSLLSLLVGLAVSVCAANATAQHTGLRVIEQSVSSHITGAVQTVAITFNFPIDPATVNQATVITTGNLTRARFVGPRFRVKNNVVYVMQPTAASSSNRVIRITTGLKSLPVNGIRYTTANYLDVGGAAYVLTAREATSVSSINRIPQDDGPIMMDQNIALTSAQASRPPQTGYDLATAKKM